MNDSTDTGLATAAWLFPYFLPRQPDKLDYQPVNLIEKKKERKAHRTLPQFSVSFQHERRARNSKMKGSQVHQAYSQPFPGSTSHLGTPFQEEATA